MKILGISCGRKNGNSELLLKCALRAAADAGADTAYLRLQDHRIQPCTGCELCSNSDNWPDGKFPASGYLCHYKKDSDHLAYIVDSIREADALILSTPIYNLTVPGSLLTLLNRIHAMGFAKHHDVAAEQHTVCATIAVGGSDMTNLTKPMLNFTAVELCGSQMNLVDQMLLQYCAPLRYVTLLKDAQARAKTLGIRVVEALQRPEEPLYRGLSDNPELCPVCHGDVIQLAGKRFRCPVCNICGDVEIGLDGTPCVRWDGGLESCRLSDNADEEEVRRRQRAPYEAVKKNRAAAAEEAGAIAGTLEPLPVPPLNGGHADGYNEIHTRG